MTLLRYRTTHSSRPDKDGTVHAAQWILTQPQLDQTLRLSGLRSSSPSISWEAKAAERNVPLGEQRKGVVQSRCIQSTAITRHSGPPPEQRPPIGLLGTEGHAVPCSLLRLSVFWKFHTTCVCVCVCECVSQDSNVHFQFDINERACLMGNG